MESKQWFEYLSKEYLFFEQDFSTEANLKDFTDLNFRILNGKMYRTNNSSKLIVAIKNPEEMPILSSFNQFDLN